MDPGIAELCMEKYTRRPSSVMTSRCRRLDSRGGMTAMCAMAAPFLSFAVRPPKMSRPVVPGASSRSAMHTVGNDITSQDACGCQTSLTVLQDSKQALLQPHHQEH